MAAAVVVDESALLWCWNLSWSTKHGLFFFWLSSTVSLLDGLLVAGCLLGYCSRQVSQVMHRSIGSGKKNSYMGGWRLYLSSSAVLSPTSSSIFLFIYCLF